MELYKTEDGLYHYGVLGMRWGVRRTPEQLRKKVGKLEKRNEKLQNRYIKTNQQSTYKRNKAYGRFTSEKKSRNLLFEANKLEARGKDYLARMMKNEDTMSVFNNTAKALDEGKVLAGNKFFMKYERATLKKQLS